MTKCRDAVRDENWPLLKMLTQGIAAKAKRVADIGRMATDQAQEPRKKTALTAAVTRLENCMYYASIYLEIKIPSSNSHSSDSVPG